MLGHKLRIFDIVILNRKWKDCQFCKNLCRKNFTYTKIATVNLSKIYLLKSAKKTSKPNNRDLNRDWKIFYAWQLRSTTLPFLKTVWWNSNTHCFWDVHNLKFMVTIKFLFWRTSNTITTFTIDFSFWVPES